MSITITPPTISNASETPAMSSLTETVLLTAGMKFNQAEQAWASSRPLRPVVTVECIAEGEELMDAMADIHDILSANGYTYSHFAVSGRYLSLVGLSLAPVAAVA